MSFRRLMRVVAVLAMMAPPAAAADLLRGHLPLAGKQVPLPDGAWAVVAIGPVAGPDGRPLERAVLVRPGNGLAEAVLVAHANRPSSGGGWGMTADCRRADLYRTRVFYDRDGFGACAFVGHLVAEGEWPLATAGLRLPDTWLVAGHRLTDRDDFLDVRFLFNPEPLGFAPAARGRPWAANDWAPPQAAVDATRGAVLEALARWTVQAAGTIAMGMKNQLGVADAPALPMPWNGPAALLAPDAAWRAARIAALGAAGTIPQAAADAQRRTLESQARERLHGAPAETPRLRLLWWKTLTNRALNTAASFGIDYLFLGTAADAASLVSAHSLVSLADYAAHEWAWMTFGPAAGAALATYEVAVPGTFR